MVAIKRLIPYIIGILTVPSLIHLCTLSESNISLWAPIAVLVWLVYSALTGWDKLGYYEQFGVFWGIISSFNLAMFLLHDKSFKTWGDVYFFCGFSHEYCTCNYRWNMLGWYKALTLWNFSISFAFGLQKLALQIGLGGLLPGEEVVTKDSFISVIWRLVPYWMNNWEQNWGTECSSMLFEVPRFAIELLVILPCVQIVASRLKILAAAQIRVVVRVDDANEVRRDNVAVNIVKGHWELDPTQRDILTRLKANSRVMIFVLVLIIFAAFNSLWIPLKLEQESLNHPKAVFINYNNILNLEQYHVLDDTSPVPALNDALGLTNNLIDNEISCFENQPFIDKLVSDFQSKGCSNHMNSLSWAILKHSNELGRMKNDDHRKMIPLIEITLAMMRFSCEKFFVLLTVYVNYLLFREPPRAARVLVKINSVLSSIFQHIVLYTFPAICWLYGAGFVFSSFVSLIFWAAPINSIYRNASMTFKQSVPQNIKEVTEEHIERMGGNCTICWGPLHVNSNNSSALPCGHAYHTKCLLVWIQQCVKQYQTPKCPMCLAKIDFEVKWRLPWSKNAYPNDMSDDLTEEREDNFLFGDPNLQNILDEMTDIPAEIVENEGHVQRMIGREENFIQDELDDTNNELSNSNQNQNENQISDGERWEQQSTTRVVSHPLSDDLTERDSSTPRNDNSVEDDIMIYQ